MERLEALDGKRDAVASAFYSHDFDWECLREEVENNLSMGGGVAKNKLEMGKGGDHGCEGHMRAASWDAFHRRHSTSLFFKERRYLLKEFPELTELANPLLVLEVGCGTGSSVVPILRGNSSAHVYACDCSLAALEKARVVVDTEAGLTTLQSDRFHPFLCNLPVQELPDWLCCIACQRSFGMSLLTVTQQVETFHNAIATTGSHKGADGQGWRNEGLPSSLSTSALLTVTQQQETFQNVIATRGPQKGADDQGLRNEGLPSSVSTSGVAVVVNSMTVPTNGEHLADKAVGTTSYSAPKGSPSCERCIGGVDVVTVFFTLSAIRPEIMPAMLRQVYATLKRGGLLLFRDYGLYDMTMLRFPASQKVGNRLYQRMDGTLCYYFSCDVLRRVMVEAGFVEGEVDFCCVQLVNRKKQSSMKRVFIHGKFHKPN